MEQRICDRIEVDLKRRAVLSGSDREHALNCDACLERVLESALAEPLDVTIPGDFAAATAYRLLGDSAPRIRHRPLRLLVFAIAGVVSMLVWLFFLREVIPLLPGLQPGSHLIVLSVAASLELTAILLWVSRTTQV